MIPDDNSKVMVQGDPRYSFHAQAAEKFGVAFDRRESVATFEELYMRLRTGAHSWAVVAVVNSTIGRIQGSYEQILKGDFMVVGKVDLGIDFYLYGHPGATFEDLRYLHTQEPAYLQCTNSIRRSMPKAIWVPEYDTAASAQIVRGLGDLKHAAIVPQAAGEAAGLSCIRAKIQDIENNTTTFLAITSRSQAEPEDNVRVVFAVLTFEATGGYDVTRESLARIDVRLQTLHPTDADELTFIGEMEGGGSRKLNRDRIQGALLGLCQVLFLN